MKLIARIFALSLIVITGASASTQVHNLNSNVVAGAKMGMMPAPGCDPYKSSCHMGDYGW